MQLNNAGSSNAFDNNAEKTKRLTLNRPNKKGESQNTSTNLNSNPSTHLNTFPTNNSSTYNIHH
jgi:hypothetical protein